MERRVLLATVLAFLVLYGYNTFVSPPPKPRPAGQQRPASSAASPASSSPAAPGEPSAAAPALPAAQTLIADGTEREITVETSTIEAVFSNRGARVLHWRLKDYRDDQGKPVDLVPTTLPASEASPFTLRVDDPEVTARLASAIYRASGDSNGRVDATTRAATLTFEYEDATGVHAKKELRFDPTSYTLAVSAEVRKGDNALNPTIAWGPGLGDIGALAAGGSFFTGNAVQPPQAIFERAGKVERHPRAKLADMPTAEAEFRFAGVDDHYFIATAVNPGQARLEYRAIDLPSAAGTPRPLVSYGIRVAGGPKSVRFYVGPKQFDTLRAVDGELVRAIDYGMFAWLVIPLLNALKWIHGYTGNYGSAIIALTVLINLVMFPLRHKSMVSMRKTQALQPKIKAIQDRYADLSMTDPAKQKMNTEVMNLYRENGVNPAAGCVPMLLTFPVLFAFYAMLSQSIELRGADFGLWIHDLSAHDPYYVTPILMGVTMLWQQWMMPATGDPSQRQMMMVMPFIFTAMFLRLPSGLAIYYLVSNVLQVAQQYLTNHLAGAPPVQAPRPPAERRIKNAGGGRTIGAKLNPNND
jgi:YidC/Oxa1 family membrane protein insertase